MKNIFATLTLVLTVLLQANLVFAHTHVQESDPKKDSVVVVVPHTVNIKFSEALEQSMSKLEVKNLKTGEIVSEKQLQSNGDKNSLQVSLKEIKNEKAKFQVSWKAVSSDSHSMKGSYEFTFDPAGKK